MTARARKTAVEPDTSPARWFARIVGVDLSLTSTGVGIIRRHAAAATDVQHLPPVSVHTITRPQLPTTATLTERARRNQEIAFALWDYTVNLYHQDLILLESPSLGFSRATSAYVWDRAGLWWKIVEQAMECGATVVTVAPATRAAWATGNGRADKAAVAAAMTRRLPDIEFANSDESDAAALAYIGAQRLGWRPIATKNEQERLEVITWPKGVHA